jgi:hypothetical protein
MSAVNYIKVSALLFAVVAFAHLIRLVNQWPVMVADMSVPMLFSWGGFIIPTLLAFWAWRLLGKQAT